MPRISVIVPVYKVEPFLHRCVDSILNQSFTDFELVLVDDGSPDNCGAMCEAYASSDSRVHVVHQENGGLSAARNTGIDWVFANSDSQWLAFVDSDDWVHRDFLRLLYEAVDQTGCPISACSFFRTSGEPLPDDQSMPAAVLTADAFYCAEQTDGGVATVAWNKLYHRSLFEKLRYPVGKLHEDEFTTYRMVYAAGKIAALETRLYAYYQNPEGIMLSQWNPRRLHILEAFEEQIAFAIENGNLRLLSKAAVAYILGIHEQLHRSQIVFHKELRAKLRQALKLGRRCGAFLCSWDTLWAYEEAYPVKPFWWLLFRLRALWDKARGG